MTEIVGLVAILVLCYLWLRVVRYQERQERMRPKEGRTYTREEVFEMLDQAIANMDRARKDALKREDP